MLLRIAFLLVVTSLVAVAGQVEALNSTGNFKVLCDDGIGQITANVTFFNSGPHAGGAKVKITGKDLPPNTAMVCGWRCAVSGPPETETRFIPCPSTDAKGKFGIEAPDFAANMCVGVVPYARTDDNSINCIMTFPGF